MGKGDIVPVGCATGNLPRHCNLTLTGVPNGDYFIRIRPIYKAAAIQVTPVPVAGSVTLSGAQAIIDVTGKANDILKRTQARVPISSIDSNTTNTTFNYPIESADSLCKLYAMILPGTVTNTGPPGEPSCLPL